MKTDIKTICHPCSITPASPFDDAEVKRWGTLRIGKGAPESAVLHKYSPAIAKLLNSTQPDIVGAVLLHHISLRQKNRCPDIWIKGGRYAVRSLHQLAHDCPYLSRSAVAKSIQRMKVKLEDNFNVRRAFVRCWYSISEDLLKVQKGENLICFCAADALFHGNIRTAVILHHMKYTMRESEALMQDDHGTRYVYMSPSFLSNALGYSDDTITRCLRVLCENKVLSRHPVHSLWYTFSEAKEDAQFGCRRSFPPANVHNVYASKTASGHLLTRSH